jgi:glucosamine-6-phosphate deaminase
MTIDPRDLEAWCRIPVEELATHETKIPFEIVEDPLTMGRRMALELVETIEVNPSARVIVPCGPSSWYAPWTEEVNARGLSLADVTIFHMDECLDAQARPIPPEHPYNFRAFMEREFYGRIPGDRNVPEAQRYWLLPSTAERVGAAIAEVPIDLTLGGWGQDGHVAYNQARRHPFSTVGLEELADSTIRVQDNNLDTVIALAHRTFGAAYQFVPPMSITLGMRECLSAARVRLYSDTGAWKQTAFRVALFSDPDPEYPITLLQRHPDARITATVETARHPLAEHPEWRLR